MGRSDLHTAELRIGRRGWNRLRARLAAKLVMLQGTRNTVLFDLSLTGARLKASADMVPGQQAVLSWAGFEAFGSLVWVENGMCGIAFGDPLAPEILVATRAHDTRDHLPNDDELERWRVREWVEGSRRV